ncbi:MAG TPA: hypothetical protein VLA12_22910, partial [Planctomycetaceae bacterium]|nr:hypothetical protein [Planctomycetaceae bacterium]
QRKKGWKPKRLPTLEGSLAYCLKSVYQFKTQLSPRTKAVRGQQHRPVVGMKVDMLKIIGEPD